MILRSETLALRTGAAATAVIVRGPDAEWADRIEAMLAHKGEPWAWQNCELLRRETGIEARFFLLHRDGAPFAHILLAETAGVGLLGHVWTAEADRGAGASSLLMDRLLADFWSRGGRALYLGTDFDQPPWHYYRRRGFEPIEPGSGYMAMYRPSGPEFLEAWFAGAPGEIQPLDWRHWPAAAPLFLGDFPGKIRISAGQLIGRRSPEGPLLGLLREEARRQAAGQGACARVLVARDGPTVLGFASGILAPAWPDTRLVDLFCHPQAWDRADELLASLADDLPRSLAYADADGAPKRRALERAGFKAIATLPQWIAADAAKTAYADIVVYIK